MSIMKCVCTVEVEKHTKVQKINCVCKKNLHLEINTIISTTKYFTHYSISATCSEFCTFFVLLLIQFNI